MKRIVLSGLIIVPLFIKAQSNLTITNPVALNILKGTYTPLTYNPPGVSQLPARHYPGNQR